MKTKLTQILLILFATSTVFAQTGVHIQEYVNSGYPGYVFNKDSVYMPVNFSTSYSRMAVINPKTKHWSYLNSVNYGKELGPFVMKNKMEGVMISYDEKVYKTTDGWKTMTNIPNVADGYGLAQIKITNAGYTGYEKILKDVYFSADGVTWAKVLDASSAINALRAYGNKVILFTGMVSGSHISTDGGKTFSKKEFGITFSGAFVDFVMLSEDTLILATSTNLYKSYDGGTTWTSKPTPSLIGGMILRDTGRIFVYGATQSHYTNDGGITWQVKNNFGGAGNYIGDDLYVWPDYRSSDNGTTWEYFLPKQFQGKTLWDVSFRGSNGLVSKSGGKVNISKDRGRSFDFEASLPTSEDIMAVHVLNNGHFIAGDRKSQIYYSSDKGKNWTNRYSNINNFNAIKFSSSANDSIILETRNGQPVVSSDFGATFSFINAGGGSHTQSITPAGKIIDAGGWFNYSTFKNKGFEMAILTPSNTKTIIDTFLTSNAETEAVVDMAMSNNNIGYLVTYSTATLNTYIYKSATEFSTKSTSLKNTITGFRASSIQVIGADTIILIGAGKTNYYYSYNGGTTWNFYTTPVHADYPSIYPAINNGFFFSGSDFIFILKNYGLYLNNNLVSSPGTGLVDFSTGTTNTNGMIKIYPNPTFNTINFDFVEISEVKIYNISGQLVFNSTCNGSVDITSLNSGFYVVQVQNTSGISTGKFIKN